jgi:nucleoside-diphosphate-sugar epimerase
VAAKAGVWGRLEEYEAANVCATKNVLAACRQHSIRKLVHTSSPSVCFDGQDHIRAGNDVPRATSFLAHYPATKARAEELVLAANGPELTTCSLRPHLVFGPGDPHILPRLVDRARRGRLRIVGDGKNEVTISYVDNAAHAHLCAAKILSPEAPHAGRAYFVGQEQPVLLWEWINDLLQKLNVPAVQKSISEKAAYRLGSVLETAWRILPLPGEPPMTRFVATQLARSHSYDMEPARRDFGYSEVVSMEAAVEATVAAFS